MSRSHNRSSRLSTDSSEDGDLGQPIPQPARHRHLDDLEEPDASAQSFAPSRPSGYTNGTGDGYDRSQGRSRSSKRRNKNGIRTGDLIRLLMSEDRLGDSKEMTRALNRVQDRLDEETKRANDAEKRLEDAYERWKAVNQARIKAEQQFINTQSELLLYKSHLQTAQATITQANEVIQQTEKERYQAEDTAERAKATLRKFKEERLVMDAREEGRRQGREEGRKQAYDDAYRQAYRRARQDAFRQLDEYLEQQGLPPLEEGEFEEDYDDGGDYDEADNNEVPDRQILSPLDVQAEGQGPAPVTTPVVPSARPGSVQPRRGQPQQSNNFFNRLRQRREPSRGVNPNVEVNRNAPDVAPIVDTAAPVLPGVTPAPSGTAGTTSLVDNPADNIRMPEPDFHPNPENVRPISMQNRSPSPRFRAVDIPPDGYIPVVGADGLISLPPPNELMNPRISPHPSRASLREAAREAEEPPAVPPKNPLSPRHRYQQSISESLASTVTSGYDLVNANLRGSPRLSAIAEQDIPPSPMGFNRPPSRASQTNFPVNNSMGLTEGRRSPSVHGVNLETEQPSGFPGGFAEPLRRPLSRSQQIANELRYTEGDPDFTGISEDPRLMSPRSSASVRSGPSTRPRKLNMPTPLAPQGMPPDLQQTRSRAGSVASTRGRSDGRRPMGGSSSTSHDDINIIVEPPSRDESLASARATTPSMRGHQMLTPETRAQDLQQINTPQRNPSPVFPVIPVIPPDPSTQSAPHVPFIPPGVNSRPESVILNPGPSQVPFATPFANSRPSSVFNGELPPNFVPLQIDPPGGSIAGSPRIRSPQPSRSPFNPSLQFTGPSPVIARQPSLGNFRDGTRDMASWDESGRRTPRQETFNFGAETTGRTSPRPVSPRPVSPRPNMPAGGSPFVGDNLPLGFVPSGPSRPVSPRLPPGFIPTGLPEMSGTSRPISPRPTLFPGAGQTLGSGLSSGPFIPGLPGNGSPHPSHIDFPSLNPAGASLSPRPSQQGLYGGDPSAVRSPGMRGSMSLDSGPAQTLGREPSHHFRTSSFGSSGIPHFPSIVMPPGAPRATSPRPASPFQFGGNTGMNAAGAPTLPLHSRPVSPMPSRPSSFIGNPPNPMQGSTSPWQSNLSLFPGGNITANIAVTQPIPSRPGSRNSARQVSYDGVTLPSMPAPNITDPMPSSRRNSMYATPDVGRQSPRPSISGSIRHTQVNLPGVDGSRRDSRRMSRASSRSSGLSSFADDWGASANIPYPYAPASPALSARSAASHIIRVPLPDSADGNESRRNSRMYPRTPGAVNASLNDNSTAPPAGFVPPLRHSDSIGSNNSFRHYNSEEYRDPSFLASEQSMFLPPHEPG